MVPVDGAVGLDSVGVAFDDERAVADAGIVLIATLARRLGIEALVDERVVWASASRPPSARPGHDRGPDEHRAHGGARAAIGRARADHCHRRASISSQRAK
jgi:hypothetical protein